MGATSTPRSRAHDAVVDVAGRVLAALGPRGLAQTGLEITIVDLDGRRTSRRVGRAPFRLLTVDLGEARDVLCAMRELNDDVAREVVAALVARDLSPTREQADWDALTARAGWVLGQFGAPVDRAVQLAVVVVEADGP
jgi:hypothetical protein